MLSYPVWSSSVEYIHVQCSTVFISFIWKRGMQFGADQSSEVQWTDCSVWYFPVQSRVVQSGEVKLRVRQSSLVKCMPSISVFWSAVRLSPVRSIPLTRGPVHSEESAPVQSNPVRSRPIPVHSLPAKYISIQRRPGPYKSIAVECIPVKCSAKQCNP